MYKYYFILRRLLSINKFSLRSLINFSIILAVSLCSFIIPLTLSISQGFQSNIENKIIKFDGYARLYNNELNTLEKDHIFKNYESIITFSEHESIIRTNNISEGVRHIKLKKIDHLNDFIIKTSNKQASGIYIGSQLSEKLFYNINSLDKNAFIIYDSNKIYKTNIIGIFKTGIPLYDKHMVIELNPNMNDYEGIIINESDYSTFYNDYYNISGFHSNINTYTYKDRYYDFIKWLNSYTLPINLLLLFIITICLVNNSFCFKIDIINRYNDIEVIRTLGFNKKSIFNLFWLKYYILNIIGVLIGSSVCFCLLLFEYNFNFIQLPEDIYFTSILPISFNVINFLYVPGILLLNIIYKKIRIERCFYEH